MKNTHNAMKHFLVTLCLVVLTQRVTLAQGVSVSKDGIALSGFDDVDEEASIATWTENETRRLQLFLRSQVNDVDKACALDEPQLDKLNLLCKGIVTRRIRSGEAQLKKFMHLTGVLPTKPDQDFAIDRQDELLIKGAGKNEQNPTIMTFKYEFLNPPYDLALWNGVLKTSLSTEQLDTYEVACRERSSNFLATAVQESICEFDSIARLQKEQRSELTRIAIRELEKKTDTHSPNSPIEAKKLATDFFGEAKNFSGVLTEDQIALIVMKRENSFSGVGWGEKHWNFHNK